jgi:hypothetical protein
MMAVVAQRIRAEEDKFEVLLQELAQVRYRRATCTGDSVRFPAGRKQRSALDDLQKRKAERPQRSC